jgi:hypothetical protein
MLLMRPSIRLQFLYGCDWCVGLESYRLGGVLLPVAVLSAVHR